MQDSQKPKPRKSSAWYQKAMQVAKLWRVVFRFPNHQIPSVDQHKHAKLRKCCSTSAVSSSSSSSSPSSSSFFTETGQSIPLTPPRTPPRALSYPSSLTRTSSCLLCSPIPYTDSFRRRSTVQPPLATAVGREEVAALKKPPAAARVATCPQPPVTAARRRVFRGKSVMDNSLMRKSVIEEEKMMTRRRRDDEFAIMQRRNSLKRRQIGPSPLSRVVMATATAE